MRKQLRAGEVDVEVTDLLKPYLIDEVSATEFYFADKSGKPAATVEEFTATAGQTAFTVAMRLDARDTYALPAVVVVTEEDSVATAGQTSIITTMTLPLNGVGVSLLINGEATAFTVADANTLTVSALTLADTIAVIYSRAATPTVTGLHTFTISARTIGDTVVVTGNPTTETTKIVHQKKTGTVWRTQMAEEYWESRTTGTYTPING